MSESRTPRTDAAKRCRSRKPVEPSVNAEDMAMLERELASMTKERDNLKYEFDRMTSAKGLWQQECREIVNALADLCGLPKDPCPGWVNCVDKIKSMLQGGGR